MSTAAQMTPVNTTVGVVIGLPSGRRIGVWPSRTIQTDAARDAGIDDRCLIASGSRAVFEVLLNLGVVACRGSGAVTNAGCESGIAKIVLEQDDLRRVQRGFPNVCAWNRVLPQRVFSPYNVGGGAEPLEDLTVGTEHRNGARGVTCWEPSTRSTR